MEGYGGLKKYIKSIWTSKFIFNKHKLCILKVIICFILLYLNLSI
jgi:hypothetical protein